MTRYEFKFTKHHSRGDWEDIATELTDVGAGGWELVDVTHFYTGGTGHNADDVNARALWRKEV